MMVSAVVKTLKRHIHLTIKINLKGHGVLFDLFTIPLSICDTKNQKKERKGITKFNMRIGNLRHPRINWTLTRSPLYVTIVSCENNFATLGNLYCLLDLIKGIKYETIKTDSQTQIHIFHKLDSHIEMALSGAIQSMKYQNTFFDYDLTNDIDESDIEYKNFKTETKIKCWR